MTDATNQPDAGKSERTQSGRTEIQDARLIRRAVREGWLRGRWETTTPKSEIIERVRQRGDITMNERATLENFRLLESADERTKGIAVGNAIAMERQNQIDDLAEMKSDAFGVPVLSGAAAPAEQPVVTNNTQINIYLPDNGRGPVIPAHHEHNGHAA